MDSKTTLDHLGVEKIGCKSINKLDDNSAKIVPITPDSNTESSEMMSCFASPLTLISCMNEMVDNSPKTLKDDVFDRFAAGTDEVTVKKPEESRVYVAKRLDFNSVKSQNDCEKPVEGDDMLLKAVYDLILECIVSGMVGEMSAVDPRDDVIATPCYAPRLTGIAETCPGPPLKCVRKSRNIDLRLCRKLEF